MVAHFSYDLLHNNLFLFELESRSDRVILSREIFWELNSAFNELPSVSFCHGISGNAKVRRIVSVILSNFLPSFIRDLKKKRKKIHRSILLVWSSSGLIHLSDQSLFYSTRPIIQYPDLLVRLFLGSAHFSIIFATGVVSNTITLSGIRTVPTVGFHFLSRWSKTTKQRSA